MLQFDVLLEDIGTVGISQIILFVLLSYQNLAMGFNGLATVFIAYTPYFRCSVPPLDDAAVYPNLTEAEIRNYSTPIDSASGEYEECVRYGYNLSSCYDGLGCVNMSCPSISCDNGYYYDMGIMKETIITEFNLVCGRSYLNALSTSMYYVGMLLGSLLFGNLSDAYGRKPTCAATFAIMLGCMFGVTFSNSIGMFMAFRALTAMFGYGATVASFVYVMEIVGNEWRTLFGIAYQMTFTIAYMVLSGIAYNWRNWHDTMLACTIIMTPFLLFVAIIPESPRWLFTKNRDKEGRKVTTRMAKLNKVILRNETWTKAEKDKFTEGGKNSSTKYTSLDLFRYPKTRLITLNVTFNWFVNSIVYYGVALNAGSLAGDLFVNNTLNGVMEMFSYVLCILLMDRVGRRYLLAGMLLTGGLGLITSLILVEFADNNTTLQTTSVVFAFVGKIGISGSFAVIYNFTSELYPTVTRSNGVAIGSAAARVAGIAAPFIISLQEYVRWLPNAIFGILGVVAGLLSLAFPETNGCDLMETIEQAEEFYANGRQSANKCSDDNAKVHGNLNINNKSIYGENITSTRL